MQKTRRAPCIQGHRLPRVPDSLGPGGALESTFPARSAPPPGLLAQEPDFENHCEEVKALVQQAACGDCSFPLVVYKSLVDGTSCTK
jgi:hypothetical protein